jgi:methylase of polypeptide subunit release factors
LIPALHKILTKNGRIFFEIGQSQAQSITIIAQEHSYNVELKQDLAGLDRVLMLSRCC